MIVSTMAKIIGAANSLSEIIHYEIIKGNAFWRFGLVLLVIIVTMVTGCIAQYFINALAQRKEKKIGTNALSIFLNCLAKPLSVAFFGFGLILCRLALVFGENGISDTVKNGWVQTANAVIAIAVAYAIYKLVDVVEYYLLNWTGKTETKLDDMLVPVIRKSLRITILIFSAIYIVDNILHQDVKSILLGAGVGGIAIALAAKDTIANFFGSITIFTDRPFQIDELVEIDNNLGIIEDVGFRSTRIRTLEGHQVTVPNSIITNTIIKNIGKRPFIRRTSNITITYDSEYEKAKKAVDIIKNILSEIPEVNKDPKKPPRVYFNEFNDSSLNIYMSYWVKPADYWLFFEVNEQVNLEMMKRFKAEAIEFAFPTQTLYVKKD